MVERESRYPNATDPTKVAEALTEMVRKYEKPLSIWHGDHQQRQLLRLRGVTHCHISKLSIQCSSLLTSNFNIKILSQNDLAVISGIPQIDISTS